MPIYAQLSGDIVAAVTQSSGPLVGPEFIELSEYDLSLCGQQYMGDGVFEPVPQSVVPRTVTMGQAKLALFDAGLLAGVEAAINGLPEPTKARALIEWNYRPTVERNSPLVASLAALVGLDDEQLDALFTAAEAL